jgi:transcriptional regulator with XRE-family HTH domain
MKSEETNHGPNDEQQIEDYWKLLGDCIRQRRLKLGLSQEQLAKAARISRTEQQYIEGATRRPKMDTLQRCCQGLGISLIELLAEVDRCQLERLRYRRS